jgi:endonuclease/exonuclease/phosphatase family metal-dependent hydrolase
VLVATYNIRTVLALDAQSCWWRRRHRLAAAIRAVDADVWAWQEASRSQIRWLARHALDGWQHVGTGRGRAGRGEACPVWARPGLLSVSSARTCWYGESPDEPGSRLPGARRPRIATIATVRTDDGAGFVVANTHLDEVSAGLRSASLTQLAAWLARDHPGEPTIVLGDLNCVADDPACGALRGMGLRPVLAPGDGPTSNGYGNPTRRSQIDHIFVSSHWAVRSVAVRRDVGEPSDHWPVAAELVLERPA